jgi:hypothetical protein
LMHESPTQMQKLYRLFALEDETTLATHQVCTDHLEAKVDIQKGELNLIEPSVAPPFF